MPCFKSMGVIVVEKISVYLIDQSGNHSAENRWSATICNRLLYHT